MDLNNIKLKEIDDLIINQIEAQINETIPLLPVSFTRILSKILAGVFIIWYKIASKQRLDIFPQYASFKETTIYGKKIVPLIEWGILAGIGRPVAATQAQKQIQIAVNSVGEILPSGTQFLSQQNGLTYITQQDYTLTAGPDTINVICTIGGTIGNLSVGQTLTLANTLGIIDNDATITSIVLAGTDSESESTYRQRVINRFQTRPQGGSLADYRIWASEVAGVTQTYIYTGDPANVLIYVAADPAIYADRIPSAGLLKAVGEACTYDPTTGLSTNRKPAGAIIDPSGDETYSNVLPITIKSFSVRIVDLVATDLSYVRSQILTALNSFFLSREPFIKGLSLLPAQNVVDTANIMRIISDIVNANNGTFSSAVLLFDGAVIPSHILEQGQLCDLDTIEYS